MKLKMMFYRARDVCFKQPFSWIFQMLLLVTNVLLLLPYAAVQLTSQNSNVIGKITTPGQSAISSSSSSSSLQFYQSSAYQFKGHSQRQSCRAHQHVYYLKTHKTGSTTMYSIFAEYCRTHDLLPLLPRGHHINQKPPFRDNQVLLAGGPSGQRKYDMVFNHHIYERSVFNHLHEDRIKITTLRDPFKQVVSSFHYFWDEGFPYLRSIPGENPLVELLKNPTKYEAKGYTSYTNNRQSMDLGYDIRHSFNDTGYIQQFIRDTEKQFDLVLITDYFHESLVIMKRQLCWSTQDILYFPKNVQIKTTKTSGTYKSSDDNFVNRKMHAKYSEADLSLYTHFLAIFKKRMEIEKGLKEEVLEFEAILEKLRSYCDTVNTTGPTLNIPAGKWSDPIYLLPNKCKWFKTNEIDYTLYLQKRQNVVLSFQ